MFVTKHMTLAGILTFYLTFFVCQGTPARDLATLHTEFFNWQMAEHPVSATYRNIHKYNDQLHNYTLEKMVERKEAADEFHWRLKNISVSHLHGDDVISYKILDDILTTYTQGFQWRLYQHLGPVTFLEGPHLFILSMAQSLPFSTRGDYENYLVRLLKLPQQYEQFEQLMREGIRLNRTYHMRSLDRLEGQFAGLQVPEANQSDFYWPFLDTLDATTIEEETKDMLRQRGREAVEKVLGGLASLWQFIRDEYLPASRTEISISSLDGGAEYYAACIRWYLSVDRTAEEVHNIGLREVDRIANNMKQVMSRQGFDGSVSEYFRTLLNDSRFYYHTEDELLDAHRSQIFHIINPEMDKYFNNDPKLPLEVHPMPTDWLRGYYSVGTPDGARPGIFYLNTHRTTDHPNFTMMALSIHETNPGHHLQSSVAILSDTPTFRQKMLSSAFWRVPYGFPGYTAYVEVGNAYVEGWALYSEYLGEEMGLYRDDYELMGRYSFEMFRACRLVVDTGIHAFNWSREKSIEYFFNYTAESPAAIEVEIDRYITVPGQALAFKFGEMKIKELREKANKHLGSRFNLQEFHSVMLDSGVVPLSVLEELVDDWLESYPLDTPDTTPVGSTCCAGTTTAKWMWIIALIYIVLICFG